MSNSYYIQEPDEVMLDGLIGKNAEIKLIGNKYFEFKKLVGCWGAPELEILAVAIVLFPPILHETLTNSNLQTPFASLVMVVHSNAVNSSQFLSRNALLTALLFGITF